MKKMREKGRKRYKTAILTAATVAALIFTGCSGGSKSAGYEQEKQIGREKQTGQEENTAQNSQSSRDSVIVVLNTESEPISGFDPAHGWGAGEHVHEPLIQSTLTVTTPDLQIAYDLATDMEVSEDGMTWTVSIRDDVKFTDGEALTAEDVAFTYNTLKAASSVNDFTMLDYAQAQDENTVVFHLVKPYSIWPYTMAITGILPEHAYGPDYGMHPIGSGRYIMKQWDRGQQVIFEANPNYYAEAPAMKTVTVLFMDEEAAFAAVKSGQADLSYTAASYSDQTVKGYRLFSCKTVDNRGFNLPAVPSQIAVDGTPIGNDFTSEVAVRRAINMGIDRGEMIKNVLNGYGSPAYSVCGSMPWDSADHETVYDKSAAIGLLEEAGWRVGADGIREKAGIRASLEFIYPADDSLRQALAADTANQLKELGIEATARGVSWDEAYLGAQSQPLMWGWGTHTPMELYNIYHTADTGLAEYSPYANETVDRYMDEALRCSDLEESYDLWKKAAWDGTTGFAAKGDLPWVWLVNVDHLYWQRDGLRVAEQKLHPHGHGWSIVNNVDRWSWE